MSIQKFFSIQLNTNSTPFRMDFWDFVRFFKNIDRCYLGPEIMIQSENGRPATKSSGGLFDSVHANGSWSVDENTNGGGFPKGIQRGMGFAFFVVKIGYYLNVY
jgi:hypothetical protein